MPERELLRAIRHVSRILARERDPSVLIEKVCNALVESRAYRRCGIVLVQDGRVTVLAEAGGRDNRPAMRDVFATGAVPPCVAALLGPEAHPRWDPTLCEACSVDPDGAVARFSTAVHLEHDGRVLGVLCASLACAAPDDDEPALLRDLAEDVAFALDSIRRRAQLSRAEARYGDLVANLQDVVFSLGADGRIEYASPAVERAFGFSTSEVLGLAFSDLVEPEDVPAFAESLKRSLHGVVEPLEFRARDKSGRVRTLRATSRVRWEDGCAVGVDGVVVDLTEQVLVRQALEASERRYRSLFENAGMGIAHCRMLYENDTPTDFVYLSVNPAFERLTGLQDVAGRRVSEVIPGITSKDAQLLAVYGAVARGGGPRRLEFFVASLDQWFDLSVYGAEPDHFVAVFDVITGRKRTEADLVTFSRRLERLAVVVQDLSQVRGADAIAEIVRHAARDLVGADGATFVLRDGDSCHYVEEDAIAPLWRGKRFPMASCISGWVMLHRREVVIEDIYADDRIPRDAYRPTFVKSLAMVPIRRQSPIGAIGSYWATRHRASDEEVRILQALADSASVAMENVRFMGELEEGRARTRAVYDHLPTPTFVWRREVSGFLLADSNEAARSATSGAAERLLGARASAFHDAIPGLEADLGRCFEDHVTVRREADCRLPGSTGTRRLVLTYGFIPADMVILLTEDVTDLRRAEEHLRLAQRLEAVGRLAGGVAHDFNNLLLVIMSYASFAIEALHKDDPVRADLDRIKEAGERATALTRQLLAFSRKQVLEPELVDLSTVVSGIEGMIRRLLGEDIVIDTRLSRDIGSVLADRGQLEQVLMNLAVNARDAMPQGGRLTIETAAVELDEGFAAQHTSVKPGRYTLLAVTDSGVGMDAETKDHIFEPFFTTKETGKGTGLGLATVYGIVKQSGGSIWVYSELGRGTTFKVYLPRVDALAAAPPRRSVRADASGHETVLVVEDEEAVMRLTERILRGAGYRVLAAKGGAEALALSDRHEGDIHLLLTDVVMPEMSGREIAEKMACKAPRLAVVYMSGYTDDAIVHYGILDPGTRFLAKPFTAADLKRKVREALDAFVCP
jgi:PAS domain S-box-containing protein